MEPTKQQLLSKVDELLSEAARLTDFALSDIKSDDIRLSAVRHELINRIQDILN